MSQDDDPAPRAVAKAVGGFLVAVVVLNLLLRLLPLPDLTVPSIPIPDLPAWLGTVMKVKNWILGGVMVLTIVCVAVGEHAKRDRVDREDRA